MESICNVIPISKGLGINRAIPFCSSYVCIGRTEHSICWDMATGEDSYMFMKTLPLQSSQVVQRWQQARICPPSNSSLSATVALARPPLSRWQFLVTPLSYFTFVSSAPLDWWVWEEVRRHPGSGGAPLGLPHQPWRHQVMMMTVMVMVMNTMMAILIAIMLTSTKPSFNLFKVQRVGHRRPGEVWRPQRWLLHPGLPSSSI